MVARKKYVQRGFSKEVEWELLKRYKERLKNFKLSQPPHPPLAFLIGFPRSGTTLLERILDTHNEIQVLDEKATLGEVLPLFTNSQNSDHFFKNIFRLRLKYFQEVLDNIEYTPNQLLVDKNPLYLREVGLIHFLFPHAKFIFAVRHPCDTCLSCFMQNFTTTPSLANFTSLEDSIVYYDEIIGLLLEQEKKYSLNIHRIRYEDLVGDFEGEGRKLLNFLNVPWQSDLDQYHKNTKNRVLVQTPSYSQVCRPIYKEARYRWLKYKNYFQPFLPIIQKYIDQFGYSSEG